jgi:Cupin superfamily protein
MPHEEMIRMRETEFDLAKLLWPVESETFFRDTWEKRSLAIARNEADYYRGLFSLHDVDSVIAFTRPKFLEPADFKKGNSAVHTFVKGLLPEDELLTVPFYPDISEVHKAFRLGQTVILTAMQHRWPPVAALCRQLEAFFGCPVHTNLYLTPKGAQGFDVHFDTHEVFVLQIEGTKHWRTYGSARELPLADERFPVSKERLGPPTQEVFLKAGDLLYLPRGHVHEAFTSESLSLHLTVGVKVYRWTDVLHQALDDLSTQDVRFRGSLPPGLLTDGPAPPAAREHFRELLEALAQNTSADSAMGRLAASFLGKLAPLPGGYFTEVELEEIGLETVLERTPGALCRIMRLEDGRTGLQFPGGQVDGPMKIASTLRFIAQTPRFAVRSLPDDLTDDAKRVLVRRLVRDKLLTISRGP